MEIIVDNLSFRANFSCDEDLFSFLGLSYDFVIKNWEYSDKRFNMNYLCQYFYGSIKIGLYGQKGWSYYVHMSGQGCRTYEDLRGEDFNWFNLIFNLYLKIKEGTASVTRIDLACDETNGIFNCERLENHIANKKYLSRCPEKSIKLVKFGEECLYVGSTQSLALLRIYNKKLERGYDPGDQEVPHWWRCEFQLRDSHAEQIVIEWATSGNVGTVYSGHVLKHIRFLTKPNKFDGTQHRINTASWWKKFLEDSEKLDWVSTKGSDYNLTKVQRFAIDNAGSSIKTMIMARNLNPQELFDIYNNDDIYLRPDQKALIKKWRG